MRPRAAGGSRRWRGTGRRPEASGSALGSAGGPGGCAWEKAASSSLLPGLVSSREEDPPPRLHPCPPRLLPVRNAPSPSPAPLRARRGGRWHGGGALALLRSHLSPSFAPAPPSPGVSHLRPRKPSGCGSPSPGASQREGLGSFLPNPLDVRARPPQPCALSPHGTSRGIPGSAVAVGGCRWPGSLPCRPPRCRDRAARFLGGSPGMCRPPGAPHVLGWRPGSGLGQGRVGISLGHL